MLTAIIPAVLMGGVALAVTANRRFKVKRSIKLIRRLGERQGLVVSLSYERDGFHYDVVWRRELDGRPTHVFVVGRKKALEALASLKHAYDLWRARGFYVTDDKGVREVDRLLGGSFHEVKGLVHCLTFSELKVVVELKERYGEILESLTPRAESEAVYGAPSFTVSSQVKSWRGVYL